MTSLKQLFSGTRAAGSRSAAPKGMTLVEIMIVITIMASIMGVVGFYVFGALDRANAKEAKIEIGNLKQMVNQYYLTSSPHRLPNTLQELTEGPAPITRSIPKDPWGSDYVYRKKGNRSFEIVSPGADGQIGTQDDISSKSEQGGAAGTG